MNPSASYIKPDDKESHFGGDSESRLRDGSESDAEKDTNNYEDGRQHEHQDENGGSDEERQGALPTPVGFWDHRLRHVRHEAFMKWTITTSLLMAFILGVMSIYWGALFHIEQNISSLVVYVVDFDGQVAPYNTNVVQPIVGPAVTRMARELVTSPEPSLGYEVVSAADFEYNPIQVRQAVFNFDAWAAIVINPNATAMLYSAVQTGNKSYDPLGACQLIYIQSRDDTTWSDFISPHIQSYMTEATTMVGSQWVKMVMQNASTDTTVVKNAALAPQALSPAIGFSQFNLRPLYPYQVIPSISIGLIYLVIISFFSFSFYLPIHFKYLKPEGHPPLKFWQLIIWRWCSTMAGYFMPSLAYSLITLAFQINFSGGNPVSSQTNVSWTADGYKNVDAYGHGTFPVYWMLNFFGMIALGLACENVAMIVGQPWTGLWLIFWVLTNLSTALYRIELEPGFYHWGYAWPLRYVVEGSRQVLFGLHSRIGLDFGVLIAWGATNTFVFPFACYFMRWKSKHHVHEYYK